MTQGYRILILLFIIFSFGKIEGQTDIVDEIVSLRDSAITEINKENYKSAEDRISNAVQLSSRIPDNELKASCFSVSAFVHAKMNMNTLAVKEYIRSAALYEKFNNTLKLSQIYYKLAKIYYNNKAYQKAIQYYLTAGLIHKESYSDYPDNYSLSKDIGDAYFNSGMSDTASFYYENILLLSSKKNDTIRIIESLNKKIKIYKGKNNDKALEINNELYNIYKLKKDCNGKAVTKNNIGYLYVLEEENEKALQSFRDAEILSKKSGLGSNFRAKTLTNIGICLQNKEDYEAAVKSLLEARDIMYNSKKYRDKAIINNILAIIYYQKNDLYNATEYSLESIEDSKKAEDPTVLKDCFRTYSTILQALDDYQKALDYFKKHLEIRDSLLVEKRLDEQMIVRKINELERSEKDVQVKMADEEVKDMLLKQLKLEAERNEKELELLNKEKELVKSEKEKAMQNLVVERQKRDALLNEQQIKTLEHDKKEQEFVLKQKEFQEKEKQKEIEILEFQNDKKQLTIEKQEETRKRFTWTFGFVLIILVLIFYSLISARRKNKKLKAQKKQIEQNNDELNQQNEEISAQKEYLEQANKKISLQNNEITDSIKYAQRIQKAVIPPFDSKTVNMLGDHFVLYKPKDIVSGDFYWMKRIGENIVIAIADCTGHGVPGAFMSMLGVSYLNEIVSKTRFDNAGLILDRLRRKVIKTLGQTGKEFEQKDGMDMVLVIIDTENLKLQYAGANNPIIIISGKKEKIIKADRMPIGIHHTEINFTNHNIKIKKGDVIYAFTDGYQDQFGGEKGKKFLTKRFRRLLREIHNKKMKDQYKILDNTLINWQSFKDEEGNKYEQVDDILVMGIKI